MSMIIYDSEINDFLTDLSKGRKVYAPSPKKGHHRGQFAFVLWEPGVQVELNYPTTILPPTEFLLPNEEVLFSFKKDEVRLPEAEEQVLFGLSLEDLESVSRLDKIMSQPVQDLPYQNRRQKTVLIGIDKYSPQAKTDFDLYLQEVQAGVFLATAKSKVGRGLLKAKYFKKASLVAASTKPPMDPILSDPDLGRALKSSRENPVWDELSEICFGCGICSYVCPLCYCFEVEDKVEFGESGCGARCRNWDSCMLKSFANTAAGNFRPLLKERIYNWYYHKFYRLPKEHGFNGCVDCNRCTIYCPAKINFHRVLARVLADYKKGPQK